tara:strand:+ start:58 stop:807 length:750 start_codon:yes stop_codon:yes gene_type:complete
MKKFKYLLLVVILISGACQSLKTVTQAVTDNDTLYQKSIENAMSPTTNKIDTNLISITRQNKDLVWKMINGEYHILVVTWKQNKSYYEPYVDTIYNTGKYQIWVTTAPELLQRMKKENVIDVDLRLKQLLGLPQNSTYSYFVEFWVKPKDLFRPCPDNGIKDHHCDLCFPKKTDPSYISWINENRISRYYKCELSEKYPWTQLGYTYDWSSENKSHIGLSEFVIDINKKIVVKAIYTTNDYLKKDINTK